MQREYKRDARDPLITGLPESHDAERSVLNSVLTGDRDFATIERALSACDFDLEKHRQIFSSMTALHQRRDSIDLITVAEELEHNGKLEIVGGLSYLVSFNDRLSNVLNIDAHIALIRKKSALRRIVFAASALQNEALLERDDPSALIATAQSNLTIIGANYATDDVLQQVPSIWTFESKTTYLIDGLIPAAALTMWSGESGDGKSTLALAAAAAVARGEPFLGRATIQRPVLVIDRENPAATIKDRLFRLGIPDIGNSLIVWGTWWEGHEPPGPHNSAIIEYARRTKPLLVWDSLVAFAGCDENSSFEMRRHLTYYRQLAALGSANLILHHRSEKGQSDYRGSSDIRAAVDNGWLLSRDDGSNAGEALGRLVLKPYKTRAGPEKPVPIEYKDGVFVPLDSPPRPAAEIVYDLIVCHRGANQKELIRLGAMQGLSQHRLVATLEQCVLNGSIEVRRGRHNILRYYLPESRFATSE